MELFLKQTTYKGHKENLNKYQKTETLYILSDCTGIKL